MRNDLQPPLDRQVLLLQAALSSGERAAKAWHEWKRSEHPEPLASELRPIMPLLYRNLHSLGVEDSSLDGLKALYHLTGLENRKKFREAAGVLKTFHQEGIPTLVLKGLPLALLYYKDPGLRPMHDVDVMVPAPQAAAAIQILVREGWGSYDLTPEALNESLPMLPDCGFFRHACGFRRKGGISIDLHWRLLRECSYRWADNPFWDSAIPFIIHGEKTCSLNTTDQLFHILVHGQGHRDGRLQWIADAAVLLSEAHADVDWERVVSIARERRVNLCVREGLRHLKEILDIPLPASFLQKLWKIPVTFERLEEACRPSRHTDARPLKLFLSQYFHYCRQRPPYQDTSAIIGFGKYLQQYWDLKHLWQVPFCAFAKTIRSIARRWNQVLPRSHSFKTCKT